MTRYLLRRIGLALITLWLLSLIVFFAGQVLPGDPGRTVARAVRVQRRGGRPTITSSASTGR